jgi:hypothetical protein
MQHNEKSGARSRCQIRQNLSAEFAIAARLYAEAVAAYTSSSPTTSSQEHNRLREALHKAHRHTQETGRALEEHIAMHECEGVDSSALEQTA